MITRNFKNLLAMSLQSAATVKGSLPITDVNGAFYYNSGNFAFPASRETTATTNATAAGISIGSGTTPESEMDYNLGNTISSGVSLSLSSTALGCDAPGKPYVLYTITVTNTGSSAVTVTEIGYKQNMIAAKYPGTNDGGTNTVVVLMDRTVLASPLTIEAGDAGVIDYKLMTVQNAGKTVSGVTITSWEYGTDEEIGAMLDAAQVGTIDLQTDAGWTVGMMRKIQIGAFTAGTKSFAAQDIYIAISSFEDYNNCGCVMQFDFVNALNPTVRMNGSSTNTGGFTAMEMYTSTLPALLAVLPEWLSSRLKTFDVLVSAGGQSTTIETITGNKLCLRSEVEVFGATTYSVPGEGAQIDYYKATQMKIKTTGPTGSSSNWWLRSPAASNANWCAVGNSGTANSSFATNANGLAPFGCI